jgi:ribosomal protein L12E/L44/L45/RPP1/RPP2
MNAFKNLAAVGIAAEYEFDQLKAVKNAAAAAPASEGDGSAETAEAEPAKEEEPEVEEEDVDMGDLFGGDDEY